MKTIDPVKLFLWTFRRNERDVINMYDSLSDVMTLTTDGDMLNFGYWKKDTADPIEAQENLCKLFGEISQIKPGQRILDVGCGYATPAVLWHDKYNPLEFFCININLKQLSDSQKNQKMVKKQKMIHSKRVKGNDGIHIINATATKLPINDESCDRILAFESPQHFKPVDWFFAESKRILKKDGLLVMALPVLTDDSFIPIIKLGLLAMTWSSEHYTVNFILESLKRHGFITLHKEMIGSSVYPPLASFYLQNRQTLKEKIQCKYPGYVETILNKSIQKMDQVYKDGIIEYLVIVCQKKKDL